MIACTQNQIAKHLGISRSAVAAVLNNRSRIKLSQETRQRVLKAVEHLHYRPHRHAQIMRKRKSGVLGMIHSASFTETLVERSIFAAKAIHESGYQFLAGDVSWYNEGLRTACDTMIGERVEGVLLAGLGTDYSHVELKRIQDAGIPIVILGSGRSPGIPQVTADNRQGMRDLTEHLIQLGHRRFAFLAPEQARQGHERQNHVLMQRVQGFQDAATASGLAEAEVLYQPTTLGVDDRYEPGRLAANGILTRSRRPEVLICSNDSWAVGAFKACSGAGVHVPEDIAITGFDNTTIGGFMSSALTTVSQPSEAMARKAVEMLVAMVRGEKISDSEELVKLPCRIVVRESCGAKANSNTRQ